jgi:hypothetical protein
VQIADRWHLLHNLSDALNRGIDRRQSLLAQAAKEVASAAMPRPEPPLSNVSPAIAPIRLSQAEQLKQNSRARRLECYHKVRALREQGESLRQIGRMLRISRKVVERYSRAEQFPERATPRRASLSIDS